MSIHPALSDDGNREKGREDFFRTLDSLREKYPTATGDLEKLILYENNLWESRRFLVNIFDNFREGIDIIDKDLKIVQINRVLNLIYKDSIPITGKLCHQVFAGRDEPCEQCPSLMAMKDKAIHSVVMLLFEGTERKAWVRITAFPIIDIDGNVLGTIEHSRNVTEDVNAEKALCDSKTQVELYLDLMGHDINNLNQIGMGFLELALNSPSLDENSRSMMSKSLMAFENSSRLIDNVRKLQKVRSGELCQKEMDAGRILADVCRLYANRHGVKINYKPVEGATVMANELLFDLFSNLVGNAIKHSNDIPVVDIGLDTWSLKSEKYYRIVVEDNGPGIPDEIKTLIFNRQLQGGPQAKGSGMGLYLVRALVEDFHGLVWVEDRIPGDRRKGSRFVVLLPAVR
ncbi:MAG TPA: ATP-binding protein [Methanocella sp.]|uniref:PAS domain-containing sensor histidine kinase n=1 Tax=Methanocella sp. TaxID=2052833 RepID=UPI002C6A31D3|nr:ATP-binding protein [Methanocella sp.]HTY92096.1 ATP-binding protein [Methanocella sp.]